MKLKLLLLLSFTTCMHFCKAQTDSTVEDRFLAGTIKDPKDIRFLDLSGRSLKTLPENISQYINLRILRLDNNNLQTLPKSLGNLKKLEELSASNNSFKTFPLVITKLTGLTYLGYDQTENYTIPAEVKSLKKLKYIFINKIYYAKNKAEIKSLLPAKCKINIPPPPPPPKVEMVKFTPPKIVEDVIAPPDPLEELCFTYTVAKENGENTITNEYFFEYNHGYNSRIIITEKVVNTAEMKEARANGFTLGTSKKLKYIEGKSKLKNGKIYFTSNDGKTKEMFLVIYGEKKEDIVKLLNDKTGIYWLKGECRESNISISM